MYFSLLLPIIITGYSNEQKKNHHQYIDVRTFTQQYKQCSDEFQEERLFLLFVINGTIDMMLWQ